MRKYFLIAILFALISNTINAQTTEWTLDKAHSNLGFVVDHMVVSEVTGAFDDFSINIKSDKIDFTDAKFEITIKTKSINTKETNRDNHLRSADFFEADKFPDMIFKGKTFKKLASTKYKITGDLTIKDVTKTISLDAKFMGMVKDSKGNTHTGIKVTGIIDRYVWGLKYNSSLDNGGLMIGQKISLQVALELIKK